MALVKSTLTPVFIFAIFLFIQCSKTTSARTHAPTPSPTDEDSSSTPTPTPTPSTILSSGPAADSPLSISELLELSLPEIGVQKVTSALQTDGAKVSIRQLEGIQHKVDEFKFILTKRQTEPTSEASKKCLSQCQENLEDAIDGVKISIESINNQDLSKANVDITSIATDVETCNDCFVELDGEDKDINAFCEWVKGVTNECLSNLKKT